MTIRFNFTDLWRREKGLWIGIISLIAVTIVVRMDVPAVNRFLATFAGVVLIIAAGLAFCVGIYWEMCCREVERQREHGKEEDEGME